MKNTKGFPLLVKIGLLGIYSKKTALMSVWLCNIIAIISIILGFINAKFFYGVLLLFSSLWYWSCIKWVDRNSKWDK